MKSLQATFVQALAVVAVLVLLPVFGSNFVVSQLGAQVLALGTVTLSLSFLAGQLGMVSLVQMSLAGVAAYAMAISGHAADGFGWQWPIGASMCLAVVVTVLLSVVVGALSARTEGVYTIMITLAVGIAVFTLVQQNYAVFNGFNGLTGVRVPQVLPSAWGTHTNLYALCLALAALGFLFVAWFKQTTLGLALNGVRDNPRRMASLGFSVYQIRMLGFGVGGFLASLGGMALVWCDQMISPGRIQVSSMVDVLIMAVLGGIKNPWGPYVGALAYVLLKTFSIDLVGAERFNLLIGLVFITTVMCCEDGLTAWVKRARQR